MAAGTLERDALTPTPRISVLMPVYNVDPLYLREALHSILGQTLSDFEILLLSDGFDEPSADPASAVVTECGDPRIRLIQNRGRASLIDKLNQGISMARGEFIARMDGDDVSLPDRFALQVRYLDRHCDVDVVGTQFCALEDSTRVWSHPTDPIDVKTELLTRGCVIGHPTVMMRRSLFCDPGIRYDPRFQHAEDYGLWAMLSMRTKLANLPEVLLRYRCHAGQVSVRMHEPQRRAAARIRGMLAAQLVPAREEAIIDLFERLFAPGLRDAGRWDFPKQLRPLLRQLSTENRVRRLYPVSRFDEFVREIWLHQLLGFGKGLLIGARRS